MGRRIPLDANPLFSPAVSVSLLAAWIAATIAVVTALCTSRSRKASSPPPSPSSSQRIAGKSKKVTRERTEITITAPETTPAKPTTTRMAESVAPIEVGNPQIQEQQRKKESLLTPKLRASFDSRSTRKMMVSLSMKLPGGALAARYGSRREEHQKQQQKAEDPIWRKAIILGERCRVPNEEDTIIYDENGQRIASYAPRTPRSLPVSRTNSFINPDAIPCKSG